jgi:(2R)-ethylmalonyl-CoA mutase
MRTYAGHSDARRSNELYRRNLKKGQTGLSVAFDLPTQTGYDPDHELARGEVGKVGVSIAHLGDMRTLLHGIPLEKMNSSMSSPPRSRGSPRTSSRARRRTTSSRST